jgi:SanA protein
VKIPYLCLVSYLRLSLHAGLLLLELGLLSILGAELWISHSTEGKLYDSVRQVPHRQVGLLLGTSKRLRNGRVNLYYRYRVEAAVELFRAGKVDYLLVSGDNATTHYNEPTTIRRDLIARGIPADRIVLDYAGFRTLDSIVRSQKVFGQNSLTVISQPFHNQRAVFIAQHKGMEAIGYNAQSVSRRYGFQVWLRERLARVKVMLDLALGVGPKFLGEEIPIG